MAKAKKIEPAPAAAPAPRAVEPPPDLGLEGFAEPEDVGLSLDELSETYASLLGGGGADPYEPAPAPPSTSGEQDVIASELLDSPLADDGDVGEGRVERRGDGRDSSTSRGGASSSEPLPTVDTCDISPRTILEAMLFVGHPGGEPLTSKHVSSLMRGVRPREIDDLVLDLNTTYELEGCPYRIESVGSGYRLTLREDMSPLRDKFYGRVKEARLSQPAIDVLAIVAYNQPLTRPELDRLRNASSGAILSQLVRRGLLRVERPDAKPREPIFYTTDRFLELFGLTSLDDLPKTHDI